MLRILFYSIQRVYMHPPCHLQLCPMLEVLMCIGGSIKGKEMPCGVMSALSHTVVVKGYCIIFIVMTCCHHTQQVVSDGLGV